MSQVSTTRTKSVIGIPLKNVPQPGSEPQPPQREEKTLNW